MTFYSILSAILLILSVFFYKKSQYKITKAIVCACLLIISLLFYAFYYISDFFTGEGINEGVIYHLRYGLEGSGFGQYWQMITISSISIILFLGLIYWISLMPKKNQKATNYSFSFSLLFISFSLTTNPTPINLYDYFQGSELIKEIITGEEMSIDNKRRADFDNYYKQPNINETKESKNLLFIYLESLEQTYSDEEIFPGLIPNINKIQSQSTYFTNIRQAYGTTYTISGMVGSQCGIPLLPPFHGNSMNGMDEFLPSATCLGDLLHSQNYYLVYQGGARLDFAGKGKFYETHNFDEVNGLDKLWPLVSGRSVKSGWGVFDDDLFNLNYEKFIELSETKEKFALFTITLDTHHPNGQPSPSCKNIIYGDGSNDMLNAIACTDKIISEFIEKIINSPYADNTIIVFASDHLAMKNTASDLLDQKQRTNRLMIFDPSKRQNQIINRFGTVFDTTPTVLSFLGFENNMALGRNLLAKNYKEEDNIEIYKKSKSWEPETYKFFGFPQIKEKITIELEDKNLYIDDRLFNFPILIELDNDLNTNLKFEFSMSEEESLVEKMKVAEKKPPFILVSLCQSMKKIQIDLPENGYCLATGQADRIYYAGQLTEAIEIDTKKIKQLTNIP